MKRLSILMTVIAIFILGDFADAQQRGGAQPGQGGQRGGQRGGGGQGGGGGLFKVLDVNLSLIHI